MPIYNNTQRKEVILHSQHSKSSDSKPNKNPHSPLNAHLIYIHVRKHSASNSTVVIKNVHENLSLEKIEKIRERNAFGLFDESANILKVDEKWNQFLQEHEIKHFMYKPQDGNERPLEGLKIQTLTGTESEHLNNAVEKLYAAIVLSQTQIEAPPEEKSQKKEETNKDSEKVYYPRAFYQQLKPSDYLQVISTPSALSFAKKLRTEDSKNSEAASKKAEERREEEKRGRIKDTIIKKTRETKEITDSEIKKTLKRREKVDTGTQKNTENLRNF